MKIYQENKLKTEHYLVPEIKVFEIALQKCIAVSGGTESMTEELDNNWN